MTPLSSTSPLASLRALIPNRSTDFADALQVAEQQAHRLLRLIDDLDGIHETHIARIPRIRVLREDLPVSGLSYWNGREWVIALCNTDSHVRQRFTLLHEFKHIIDHGSAAHLYSGNRRFSAEQQAEIAADFFAGCALVGKRELKAAWAQGIQRTDDLAHHFNVSKQAIGVRLAQTGVDSPRDYYSTPARCARPSQHYDHRAPKFRVAHPQHTPKEHA